jgi:hypothetical protein
MMTMMFLDSNTFLSLSVLLLALAIADAATAITNANFKEACDAWQAGDTITYGNITYWDTSKVTDMSSAFKIASWSNFNDDIGAWDTSNVTDMSFVSIERITCCLGL